MRLDVAKLKEIYKGYYGNQFATKEGGMYMGMKENISHMNLIMEVWQLLITIDHQIRNQDYGVNG